MAISWSDAVSDADDSNAIARYQRAISQVHDLEPLVRSFIRAVADSGKWPHVTAGEYDSTLVPASLQTRFGFTERHVWCYIDGHWGLNTSSKEIRGILVNFHSSGQIDLGGSSEMTTVISAPNFDLVISEMEATKDWVPKELVAYLRRSDIPIPG